MRVTFGDLALYVYMNIKYILTYDSFCITDHLSKRACEEVNSEMWKKRREGGTCN